MQPFQTYLPAPDLRPYVKTYLILEADFGAGFSMDAVSRGLPVLGFSFRPDHAIEWIKKEGKPSLGKSVLIGQTTQTVSCLMHGLHQTQQVMSSHLCLSANTAESGSIEPVEVCISIGSKCQHDQFSGTYRAENRIGAGGRLGNGMATTRKVNLL